MNTPVRLLPVAIVLFLAATSAQSAAVTLNGVANSQVIAGGYAGFYSLTVDSQTVLGLCDDYNTHVNIGDNWTADVYTYADIQSGAGKFGPNPVIYSQAGYLFSLAGSADAAHQASIDAAIWNIMDGGTAPALSSDPNGYALGYYLSATDGSHNAFDYSGIMEVLTARPPGASQEYLIPLMQPVPVPAAAWLFGSALGLLGLRRNYLVA